MERGGGREGESDGRREERGGKEEEREQTLSGMVNSHTAAAVLAAVSDHRRAHGRVDAAAAALTRKSRHAARPLSVSHGTACVGLLGWSV
mgnify:FL=1